MNTSHNSFNPVVKLALSEKFIKYVSGEKIVPIGIEVSPSGICNAKCSFCFYKWEPRNIEFIDSKVMFKMLSDMHDLSIRALTWTGGGEPTLHKELSKFIVFAYERGIHQGLFTNGIIKSNINPELLEWIRITISDDTMPDEKAVEYYRKCKGLGLCVNYTGDYSIIEQALKLGEKYGVDYVQVRPALEPYGVFTKVKKPEIEHPLLIFTEYKFSDSYRSREYRNCTGYNFVPFVWENGDVTACAYQHTGKYVFGNLHDVSLKYIIEKMPVCLSVDSDCQVCCKNHEINKFVSQAISVRNINFP